MARNTRSSTGMACVNTVEVLPSGKATCLAKPLIAGPAGFAALGVPSPGCKEILVVLGVQSAAPKHVSRTNTWRSPLFVEPEALVALEAFGGVLLFVIATNATNLPLALIEGKIASIP